MRLHLIAAAALLSVGLSAHASSYVYDVSLSFGNASVQGTITTDTNSGTLISADITDFSLLLTQGANSLLENPGNAVAYVFGTALTATASGLDFNFDSTAGSIFDIQNPYTGSYVNFFCLQDSAHGCVGAPPAGYTLSVGNGTVGGPAGDITSEGERGNVQFATSPVPEPSTFALFGTGILGLAGAVRRRFTA